MSDRPRGWNSTLPTGKPLGRKTQIRRTKRINKRNRERQEVEFERCYHSVERVKWIQRQPSIVSGKGPCVNAHVTPDEGLPSGTGRKADYWWIVPLTDAEHTKMHALGEETFARIHGVDLAECARETDDRWQRYINPDPYDMEPDEDRLKGMDF